MSEVLSPKNLVQAKKTIIKNTLDASETFLTSEKVFVEDKLRWVYETFFQRLQVHIKLKKPIIEEEDILAIFGNIEILYTANSNLYADLLALRMEGREALRDGLGKTMQAFIPYLKVYTDYIGRTKERNDKVEELKSSNKKFRVFIKINGLEK
ncbi:Rho/RAC guanine nucleotide exchange factor [Reticulomyxa filosa]|uniref:Rho/RAC guanine nucleotide exchange factor n=1 Tax=Reticulomyxa filosa TaxID=46433 RepID=X6MF46_RETFI|nr:Rho/RAC guanine nucleotide exchange factor [Reticulomyxa filosa]|eukprot:ETO12504.1 Rho/RAC guanine nucleotide exchange factor [Reticulomyxa filosa]